MENIFKNILAGIILFISVCVLIHITGSIWDTLDKPLLPTVKSQELQCLSDDAYSNLVKRDRLQNGYREYNAPIDVKYRKDFE